MRNVALLYKYGAYQHTLMYGAAQENVTIFQIMCMKRFQSRNTPYHRTFGAKIGSSAVPQMHHFMLRGMTRDVNDIAEFQH